MAATNKVKNFLGSSIKTVREILYGMTIYEMVRDLQKERSQREHLFALIVFGDMLGVPILPPYYNLRILPYIISSMPGLKMRLSRERDFTDLCDTEIT